ncbi:MAG: hypothetical protein SNJ61_03905, partial [Fimbriimonadaceae bacterium]
SAPGLDVLAEPQNRHGAETPTPASVEDRDRPSDQPAGVPAAPAPTNGVATARPIRPTGKPKPGLSDRPVPTLPDVFQRLRELEDLPVWTRADEATAKALVCDFRAVEAAGLSPDEKSCYRDEMERLSELFGRHASRPQFFGFNELRRPGLSAWLDLGEAYGLMAEAENACDWLAENPCSDKDQLALYELSAAAESLVHRLMESYFVDAADLQQSNLHERLATQLKDRSVKVWLPSGTQRLSDGNTRKLALDLPVRFNDVVERFQKAQAKQAALDDLDRVLGDDDVENFENRLISAVESVLEAKVPPSDKTLRAKLMPYRHLLQGLHSKLGKKLLGYVSEDFEKLSSKAEEAAIESEGESEEHAADIDPEVLSYTQGKTFMMVGGSKGQEKRKTEYRERLGFCDVIWPDLEWDSNPSSVRHLLKRADIVAFAIRFSRHSYKKIVDDAKAEGKTCVILKAGLSTAQLAHALRLQVVSPKASA